MNPETFFTDLDTDEWPQEDYVKSICKACPVRQNCVDYAVSVPWIESGYWGSTRTQRIRLRGLRGPQLESYSQAIGLVAEELVGLDA
jgi:hypothetical protein